MCGTDLEAARAAKSARRRIELPRSHWPGRGSSGTVDWTHFVVAVLVAIAIPPVGFLLSLFWASRRHRDGEPVMTALMLAAAVLAAAAMFAPQWFFSHLFHI